MLRSAYAYIYLRDIERGSAVSALNMVEERYYTVKEVADALRFNPRTVRKMIAEGELPAFKVRDEWRVRQRDIDTFIAKHFPEQNTY